MVFVGLLSAAILTVLLSACIRPASEDGDPWSLGFTPPTAAVESVSLDPTAFLPEPVATRNNLTPTPNAALDLGG